MATDFYFRVFVDCFCDASKAQSFFLKVSEGQSIGDALANKLEDMDVKLIAIKGSKTSQDRLREHEMSNVDPETPGEVLRDFQTNVLSVSVKRRDADNSPQPEVQGKNVFDILMAVHKQYSSFPPARKENHSKDRLFNQVLGMFKDHSWGFTPMQVDLTGSLIIKTLTDCLWFLDPHIQKLEGRGINLDFKDFHGFNDWKSQKKKEPKLSAAELEHHTSKIVDMLSLPYFLNQDFALLRQMCNNLVDGMKKYLIFLKRQQERTAENHQKTEPVRSLSDSWALKDTALSAKVEDSYGDLHQELQQLQFYQPLFLFNIQPTDRIERRNWLQKIALPYPAKLYSLSTGNYFGNFNFIWRVEDADKSTVEDVTVIQAINKTRLTYTTRAMRSEFINRYSKKIGAAPAVLRDIYRYLMGDSSAAETTEQSEVDKRVAEFLLTADDPDLIFDLRKNNGRPKDTRLDAFWEALDEHIQEFAVVHERRQSDKMYMPIEISVDSLIDTISKKLPEGTRIPSASWVAFQFWPSNAYVKAAMAYTGRFKIRHAVQQRLTRAKHPDAGYAFHQLRLLKEMAVKFREESEMICLDDKSIIPIGEPGCPVSTGVRAHNKSLIPVGAKLSALDHDFHVHGAVPSVLFQVNIPENAEDSFYDGIVNVTLKDKVYMASTAMRHATESAHILRSCSSTDGLSLDKPRLFIYTDGGPDHRSTFWTVHSLALFVGLDLDLLITARTAPSHSYTNPAERCMSLLNLALQNTAIERTPMHETAEFKVKSLSTMKKLRDATARQPRLKQEVFQSLEAPLAFLKSRFARLKLHGEYVQTHDAAKSEDIDLFGGVLDIFRSETESPSITSCTKAGAAPPKLKQFMDSHCVVGNTPQRSSHHMSLGHL